MDDLNGKNGVGVSTRSSTSNGHEHVFHRSGFWQVKLMWVILFMFCFHKASEALNWVRFVVSEAQSDITSLWWCLNVAVRLMGYPTEAEMVWSTTKDHLQVCSESDLIATLTAKGNNKTPAQASLQSPPSHARLVIQINIDKVDIISDYSFGSLFVCVFRWCQTVLQKNPWPVFASRCCGTLRPTTSRRGAQLFTLPT